MTSAVSSEIIFRDEKCGGNKNSDRIGRDFNPNDDSRDLSDRNFLFPPRIFERKIMSSGTPLHDEGIRVAGVSVAGEGRTGKRVDFGDDHST